MKSYLNILRDATQKLLFSVKGIAFLIFLFLIFASSHLHATINVSG